MFAQARAVLLGSVALCVLNSPLVAQTWTAEQQAVLAVVEDTWTENDPTWVTRLTHPEMARLEQCESHAQGPVDDESLE